MTGRSRQGWLARVAAIATGAAILLAVLLAPATAQQGLSEIEVRGNQRIDTATVLTFAGLDTGEPITAGQLNAAKQRILASGLFETVEITIEGRRLVVEVEELPTINQISIEGNRRLSDDVLSALLTSQSRRVYSPTTATEDARAITEAYFDAGRLAATVTPRIIPRSQNRVDLVFEVTEGDVVEVERIGFVGNRSYSDRRLRQALETKQAGLFRTFVRRDTFLDDRVQFDIQVLTDFYRSRGFIDFEVLSVTPEFSRERDAFFLTFTIREGQRFRLGEITVSSEVPGLDASEYENVPRARTGQFYSPIRIDDAIARLEREAIERGFDFVRATPEISRNDRALTLDVNFELERGPRIIVERIDIEGNSTTLDRVIRRQFRVVEGDPFNPREIRDSAERIRALGFFGMADVDTREGTAPDRVIVDVNVEEQPTGSITLGANFSLDDGFGLAAGLSERNFLGRGQTLNFQLALGVDNLNSQLSFVEPALLGRDVTGVFDLFFRRTDNFAADFNTERLGFNPSVSFPVSDNGRLELLYLVSRDEISDVDEESSEIIQREEGTRTTSAVGYRYTFNSRRTGLDPNERVRFEFGQDFAGVGGDNQYVETLALAGYDRRVFNEDVGVTAELSGAVLNFFGDETGTVLERFRSAGIRGFSRNGIGPRDLEAENEDALGGNFRVGFTLETDFPIGLPEEYGIRGGLFYDAGSVWGLDDTEGTNGVEVDDGFFLRQVLGATLFWDTPIGPLRFDFTRAIQKEDFDDERTFDFRISTRF